MNGAHMAQIASLARASEERLVADLESGIRSLCSLMNEAALRGITVSFNIDKNAEGHFEVQKLEMTKKLK